MFLYHTQVCQISKKGLKFDGANIAISEKLLGFIHYFFLSPRSLCMETQCRDNETDYSYYVHFKKSTVSKKTFTQLSLD